MSVQSQAILFNHIPKTGGTTLRIILNRYYGIDNVYFVDSMNIAESLKTFREYSKKVQAKYKVISGHGAFFFKADLNNPFKITVLREPISLFISQYEYLAKSPNSVFQDQVSQLYNLDEYIDFAIEHGQDNLLVRYLSEEMNFLIDKNQAVPQMSQNGDILLEKAISNLKDYNLLFDLDHFDSGIYNLARLLNWKSIPIYRPYNRTKYHENLIPNATLSRLKSILKWDISLYNYYKANYSSLEKASSVFLTRQSILSLVAQMLGKY